MGQKLPAELVGREDGICAAPGCSKVRKRSPGSQGLKVCGMHYERWRDHGSFELPPQPAPRVCLVEGCERLVAATHGGRGLCATHYQRWRKHGADGQECAVEGCPRNAVARSLCGTHYAQLQRSGRIQALPEKGRPCSVEGCTGPYLALGYCRMHYKRWQSNGDAAITQRFHGRGSINVHGYRMVPATDHPNAHENGQIAEHRLVMTRMLGRRLFEGEEVHHKNGNRLDNRPENLELWIRSHPAGQRVEDVLAWAHELIARYEALPDTAAAV